jgi:hypothetical protein
VHDGDNTLAKVPLGRGAGRGCKAGYQHPLEILGRLGLASTVRTGGSLMAKENVHNLVQIHQIQLGTAIATSAPQDLVEQRKSNKKYKKEGGGEVD